MDPEIKTLLEKNLALNQENNQLLKKMNRRAKFGSIMHLIYWLIIIGFSVGSYYFIQPYINQLISTYSSIQTGVDNFNSFNPFKK
ncbi:MAG: hypothetical protein PHS53_04885 [Candidatus Pacebacteria bacterium]|nr:hypothetical protein [Candidatus Paceibacterota bacterium]MDD5357449.1 hypothetical protein [Candidatus Paceibacterota bacterium]